MFCVSYFFFKQKTAYEMRISDWSSDVCSSDLPEGMVNITPPELSPALLSSWRTCERRCPKETAILVSDFTAKMMDLEQRSEGAGIHRPLDPPNDRKDMYDGDAAGYGDRTSGVAGKSCEVRADPRGRQSSK